MSQNSCECTKPVVEIPVRGLTLKLDEEAFGSGGGFSGDGPNLQIGVEVKRNMFYMGKQVYSQLINCGPLPSALGSRSYAHGIENIEWVAIDNGFSRVGGSDGGNYSAVLGHPSQLSGSWYSKVDAKNISITVGINRSSLSAVICLNYTKTTDPVIG